MEEIIFKELKRKDIDQIANWENEFKGTPELFELKRYIFHGEYEDFYDFIDVQLKKEKKVKDSTFKFLVCKTKYGEIVGFITFSLYKNVYNPQDNEISIGYVAVKPSFRHKNIGCQIIDKFPEFIQSEFGYEFNNIHSYIEKTNISSISMFERLGYQIGDAIDDNFVRVNLNLPLKLKIFE